MNKRTVILCIALTFPFSLAYANPGSEAGKVLLAKGEVNAAKSESGEKRPLKRRSSIYSKEQIHVGTKSQAQLRMIDDALISLRPETVFFIDEYIYKEQGKQNKAVLKLISGGLRTITGTIGKNDHTEYSMSTPLQTIGIRGTDYELLLLMNGIWIAAWQGTIDINSSICPNFGGIRLGDNEPYKFVFISDDCKTEFSQTPPKSLGNGSKDPTVPPIKDQPIQENTILQNPRFEREYPYDDFDEGFFINLLK